jgi:chemotaxis protein histidine kinase CheA
MGSASSALEFFVLEASGYIDGLDSLLGSAGAHGPDREAFVRLTRALRGNSVMYRQPGITTVATALEGCARALREGRLTWAPHVHAALTATIDDLRILVRDVRQWSDADDQRANDRAAELDGLVPRAPTPSTAVQAANEAGSRAYLAGKTRDLGATLARLSAEPRDPTLRTALARDVRVLSGVAMLREYPALSRVVAGLERESTSPADDEAGSGEDTRARLRRTANALGAAAAALESGDAAGAEGVLRESAGELEGTEPQADRVVAIDELYYGDAGPTVVEASGAPPTRPAERFRMEVVGLAEHARRAIGELRRAPDDSERERGWRTLERAFGDLVGTARSFGESAVAVALGAWERSVATREAATLDSLDEAAAALADPALSGPGLRERLEQLGERKQPQEREPAQPERAAPPSGPSAPSAPPEPPAPRPARPTPTGVELRAMLESGISELDQLDQRPLTPPVPLPQERVVPIETLLYRGDAALRRAREIRDEIRATGGPPEPDTLDELFALLDLVQAR